MANTKKYVSLDKLELYDEKIKKVISDGDTAAAASALAEAKKYADGLAVNYDAAGAAATALADAKTYADGKDSAIQAAQKAGDDAAVIANRAEGKADTAQGEVDALEAYVGTFTHDTAKTVVEYINAKTDGIATSGNLEALGGRVTTVEGKVAAIEGDYLKAADKTAIEGKIAEVQGAVDAEKSRAEGIEAGLESRLAAVEGDYLKADDKTELQGGIDGVAGRVAAIEGDYLKAADKTELQGKIDLKAAQTALDAEVERATNAEASLQNQINTIMNNPDTEGVINSINEFTQYIADHGEIAEGFRVDIDANAKAIEDHEALAAQTYETKEDATAKFDEVKELVNAKAVQADWNQNDSAAADYVKNRTHYDNSNVEYVVQDVPLADFTSGAQGSIHYVMDASLESGKTYGLSFNGAVYTGTADSGADMMISGIPHPADSSRIGYVMIQDNRIMMYGLNDIQYDWKNSGLTLSIYSGTIDIKQLDEKFIPDTIARSSDVEDVAGRMTTAEGKITTLEGKVEANELAIAGLQEADAGIIERVAAVEAQLGDGDGSVADLIADAKQEAIDAAAADATTKANTAEGNAKTYADGLNTAMDARVVALEAIDHDHSNKAELDLIASGDKAKWDAAAAIAHSHDNKSVLDGITAAKVAAWDAAEQAAKTYADGLNSAMDTRVAALEGWHNNFTEVSEQEINDLFA